MHLPGACPLCGFGPDSPGYHRTGLPAGHPDFGKLLPCPGCHGLKQNRRHQERTQLDGQLRRMSLDNYRIRPGNEAALAAARRFVAGPTGWLTFWGGYGVGKTHLLAAIANHCKAHGIAASYYTLPDLLDLLRHNYQPGDYDNEMEQLKRLRVLVVDEVDKPAPSAWAREKCLQLFDARYRTLAGVGTVLALNRNPQAVLEAADPDLGYLCSRMIDEQCRVVPMLGSDARSLSQQLRQSKGKG